MRKLRILIGKNKKGQIVYTHKYPQVRSDQDKKVLGLLISSLMEREDIETLESSNYK